MHKSVTENLPRGLDPHPPETLLMPPLYKTGKETVAAEPRELQHWEITGGLAKGQWLVGSGPAPTLGPSGVSL